ncbi:hypothetical protein HN51_070954 [Arachis hypogaea]|uniref:Uncharacterized protein n=1 Tax=Arachis hypogaea TaxID=3818 RepID=A0A444Z011_ARAHY|nr:uncharacterized protein LOC110263043 [Arachis ipaensis]QHO13450.1 uncharacterized protein DS421_15g515650 [Arachis hypogaea]RYR07519.1 hypothetical protein Ahy_B05g074886 [Arachis hypogaea]
MDIKNRCHSCKKSIIQFGRCCNDEDANNSSVSLSAIGSSKLRWKVLWMKLKMKKKKLFDSSSASSSSHPYYDAYTYSQNFDHGNAKDEADNLSRSFSARFADSSKVTTVITNHKVL